MTRLQFALAAAVLAAAPACATAKDKQASADQSALAPKSGEFEVGSIEDSALPPGECGMILWTLTSQRPAPIFRLTAGKRADVVINGKKRALDVTGTTGATAFGVAEEQTLAGEGFTATVKMRFGLGFDGGSYLERGLLTVEGPDGWRVVLPAAGIAGCRGKAS